MKSDQETVALRLDIFSLALSELARALPVQEAARATDAIARGVANRIANQLLCDSTDAAVTADLVSILAALQRHP